MTPESLFAHIARRIGLKETLLPQNSVKDARTADRREKHNPSQTPVKDATTIDRRAKHNPPPIPVKDVTTADRRAKQNSVQNPVKDTTTVNLRAPNKPPVATNSSLVDGLTLDDISE